jgi:hypothetical protein
MGSINHTPPGETTGREYFTLKSETMELQFFKEQKNAMVGSYMPSENWNKFTHFAVMDEKGEMLASCGYFQSIERNEPFEPSDYLAAASSIEQAQLYANAIEMFNLLDDVATNCLPENTARRVKALLKRITDISEPAKRLLGGNAMKIIEIAKQQQENE